jgi:hypothetical protein
MHPYLHRQRAGRWLAIPATVALGLLLVGLLPPLRLLWYGVPFLGLMMWIFGSLTISVERSDLCWRFGPGVPRFRLSLTEIVEARTVITSWQDGWGIHGSRFGTLYNVAGFEAVALTLRSGRRLALGTDEPHRLLRVLTSLPSPSIAVTLS